MEFASLVVRDLGQLYHRFVDGQILQGWNSPALTTSDELTADCIAKKRLIDNKCSGHERDK